MLERYYRSVRAVCQRPCPLRHRKRCHLSQGERLWQAGPLFTGRPRPDRAQKGGPCYRGQARLRTTSQALRASSPSRGASGETVHFAGTAKASPTRGGGIAQAMTERLYEGRGFGRPEGAKTPFRRLLLREGRGILRSSAFLAIVRLKSNIASFAKLDFRAKLEHRK